MKSDLEIAVKSVALGIISKKLGAMFVPKMKTDMMRSIGINVREHTADHIADASDSRHKSADRLGAAHTGFLEFAPGRGQMRSESEYEDKDGQGKPFTEVQNVSTNKVDVVIGNTPGLSRAFGPITITPKKAKALTIPINKISYAKRVGELKDEGFKIFKLPSDPQSKRDGILATEDESGGIIPLYVLCGKVTIPQDRGLLPSDSDIEDWCEDSIVSFMEKLQREVFK